MGINNLFLKLADKFDTQVDLKISREWKVDEIDENSPIGKQIQYYRRKQSIKQRDLAKKIKCDRGVISNIENKEYKLLNINLLNTIIDELDIRDKININDEYIEFILNGASKKIKSIMRENNMTRAEFSKSIGVHSSVVKKWEYGKAMPTRKSFNKIKKHMV